MRHIYRYLALAAVFACFPQLAVAQGYDPNQAQGMYGQQNYQQPPVSYQQYQGIPQTSPNYGYDNGYQPPVQPQYGQQQYGQPAQQAYQQAQLQQQHAQYGQMPQAPVYYGQAQQSTQGSWPQQNNSQPDNQMPAGSFLNDDNGAPGSNSSPPDRTVTETPSGNGHAGAAIKGAAGLFGKVVGKAGNIAAPAASMYLMNKATGGNIRYYMPAPVVPMPGMGMGGMGGMGMYGNPYMGTGMRTMMGGW